MVVLAVAVAAAAAALWLPARHRANAETKCAANLTAIGFAVLMYSVEWEGMPPDLDTLTTTVYQKGSFVNGERTTFLDRRRLFCPLTESGPNGGYTYRYDPAWRLPDRVARTDAERRALWADAEKVAVAECNRHPGRVIRVFRDGRVRVQARTDKE